MNIRTLLKVASAAFFFAFGALAQAETGTVTNHAFALGRGPGVTGFTSMLCTSAQLAIGQSAADPICTLLSGDVTMSAGGVTAIGASKVTNAMLATMAANTTKCNATGGTANPTDCTAATMRTNLALVPGTNVEAWDADLDALAALAGTGIARRTATNSWSVGTAVTNAELATMAANTVKANATSGSAVPTDLAVPSCSAATSALTWTTNTGFGCNSIAGGSGSVIVPPTVRLTLTQGTAVTTSDVTAATSVFLEPYGGGYQVQVYDGVSAWSTLPVAPSTYSLPATQTQTCTLATSTTVTGCTDTSQMAVGQQVTGTNIPASDTIASITNSTSFVLASAATGAGATSLTFKLPPSTNYDVYVQNNGGVPRMIWSAAWSNDTTPPTRTTQNGILVASGATTKLLLGSARTTSIAGQLEDSALHGWLFNLYNAQPRSIKVTDTTASWAGTTGAWGQARSSSANQADVLFGVAAPITLSVRHMFSVSTTVGTNAWCGIGIDSTSVSSATLSIGASTPTTGSTPAGGAIVNLAAEYEGAPGIGRHTFPWLEYGAPNGTFYGSAGTVDGRAQTGLVGWASH